MRFLPRRYLEEFFLYSSQFVIFYIIILFASPPVIRPTDVALVTLIAFLLMQIGLLARYGHRPLARFAFSLMTPLGYSGMQSLSGPVFPLDMASFFLWATAIYLGGIQALGVWFRRKWPKRIAETLLTLGTVFTFIFFYFYLDLRLTSTKAYDAGELGYQGLIASLALDNFIPAFVEFAKSSQHIFFMFGALMFGLFQMSDKIKQISLQARLDSVYAVIEPPRLAPSASQLYRKGATQDVAILYADLWNFTALVEKEGATETMGLLNRYYGLWDLVVRRHNGVIEQFVGDSVVAVFGLLGDKDYAENAVNCALDFQREFPYLQEDLASHRLPLVKHMSVGVHAGKATVGELSVASGDRRVSVLGDVVAMAARLDSLCREFRQEMLVSAPAYKLLSLELQSKFQTMGEVLFRGKTQPQAVYGQK